MIDTLKARTRNWIKKTGDTMIDGFLTLFQDPVEDMHAVTKRYVDGRAVGTEPRAPYAQGRYYTTPAFGNNLANLAWATGTGRLSPFFVHRTITFTGMHMWCGAEANRGIRLGIYRLDRETLMPTELILNAGTFVGPFANSFRNLVISQELTLGWYGLAHAMFGAGANRTFEIQGGTSTVGYGWYGANALTSATPLPATALNVNSGSGLSWATNMPDPGDWAIDSSVEALSGVWMTF